MMKKYLIGLVILILLVTGVYADTYATTSPLTYGVTTEVDPVYSAWDKSTGISITESQVSDLAHTVDTNETTRVDVLYVNASDWNEAYSWGDHALEGYLTTYTDTNETTRMNAIYDYVIANRSDWDEAYSWGNHASAGYLTTYTDTNETTRMNEIYAYVIANRSNWDTAYTWGNHADNGYWTSSDNETDPFYYSNPYGYYNSSTLVVPPAGNDTTPYVQYIDFNTTATPTGQEGRLYWNGDDGTLNLGLSGGTVNLQVGQEMVFKAQNKQGATINNGELVYVSGATGSVIEVKLSNATHPQHSLSTLAFATEDINNNQLGYFTTSGLVRDLNTSALSEGSALFLSETDGGFTTTPPTKGNDNRVVFVGFVVRSHATEGVIFAKIIAIPFLDEISDVVSVCNNNQYLVYDNTTLTWNCTDVAGAVSDVWVNESGDNMTGTLYIESGNGNLVSTNAGGGLDVMTSTGQAGYISFGNTADIGISQDGVVNGHDYDGAFIIKQKASNPTEDVEFIFIEEAGDWRFALPSSGANHGTYNPRSMIIAGASVNNESNVHCDYWGFSNLDCDTGATGADLGVQDDLEVLGKIYSADWSDVSITESQVSDLSHTVDTNETTRMNVIYDWVFTNHSNWDTAFTWGNHASAGYLVGSDLDGYYNSPDNETDPIYSAWDKSTGISITESQISDLSHTVDTNETTRVNTLIDDTEILNNLTYIDYQTLNVEDNVVAYFSFDRNNITSTTLYETTGQHGSNSISGININERGLKGDSIMNDASAGYANIPTGVMGNLSGLSEASFSFWVSIDNVDTAINEVFVMNSGSTPIFNYQLWSNGNTYVSFTGNTNRMYFDTSAYMTNDYYHHVVMVFNGSATGNANRLKTYVDGVEVSGTYQGTIPATTGTANNGLFMSKYGGGNYMSGELDEFIVYNVSLGQTEISSLYNNGGTHKFGLDPFTTATDTLEINGSLKVTGNLFVTGCIYYNGGALGICI